MKLIEFEPYRIRKQSALIEARAKSAITMKVGAARAIKTSFKDWLKLNK